MTKVPPMVRRRDAAQATLARFGDVPLKLGKNDCVRMGAFALRQMGHRPQLGRAGSYSTPIGAVRALKRAGYASLADALDGLGLARIAPAAALPADILLLASEGPLDGAIAVVLGNGRALAYHQHAEGAVVVHPVDVVSAWRVPPK
ncbi:hypothetical protein ASE75_06010 [Sphingomonas sp. Leaf17]|uniref:DUF6950 family protein n=1 Tax=Sphingomonas sp. Leaf17 TaxID=1735683 RepID=UPI0006FF4833|nr:hypothetical protein [Sphingomonas sp. Leaf17]KQM65783.1 hypothetical protein ASE75_06010 [Sphingomonas sp. Leaf17]